MALNTLVTNPFCNCFACYSLCLPAFVWRFARRDVRVNFSPQQFTCRTVYTVGKPPSPLALPGTTSRCRGPLLWKVSYQHIHSCASSFPSSEHQAQLLLKSVSSSVPHSRKHNILRWQFLAVADLINEARLKLIFPLVTYISWVM